MSDADASNLVEYSVSEISGALRRTIESAFGQVRVRGEVSGFKGPHASGHCYFSLKDQNARLEAVIWKSTAARLKFLPQEGLEVIATGRITTFPGSSKYQIVIDRLEPAGIGALMALLEERRRKLAAEGLFDEARKKPPSLSAARHRRHHLSDGRRDPRHPASSRRSVSAIRPALARARARRRLRGRGRGRDPRLQRSRDRRRDATAGSDHRGARRRLARGFVGVQRGGGGTGGGAKRHPADFRRRP